MVVVELAALVVGEIGPVAVVPVVLDEDDERIEVVKGPQSTLYGTDAMGGVINVITRSPAEGMLGAALTATGG